MQMFNRTTGDIDPGVVKYWSEHYDIARKVTREWRKRANICAAKYTSPWAPPTPSTSTNPPREWYLISDLHVVIRFMLLRIGPGKRSGSPFNPASKSSRSKTCVSK
ncbi:MAG: hypothetical protein ABI383_13330 [Acidobacteriaceae bacterium]